MISKDYLVDKTNGKDHKEGDIAIIGGGPAGVSAALTLLKESELKVCVIDNNNHPFQVGEVVHSSLLTILKSLKIESLLGDNNPLLSTGLASTWGDGILKERNSLFNAFGHSYHLDRSKFNSDLLRVIQKDSKAKVFFPYKVVQFDKEKEFFSLKIFNKYDSKELHLRVRFIIDCSGRRALFARQMSAQNYTIDNLVAISRLYTHDPSNDDIPHSVLTESVQNGWWYSALLPDQKLVTTFMCDVNDLQKQRIYEKHMWEQKLQETKFTQDRVQGCHENVQGYRINSALSHYISPAGGKGWVAAGDAACSFDPLSSIGIGHAMVSGTQAGRIAYQQLCNGKDYTDLYSLDIKNNFSSYLRQRQMFYQGEQRWSKSEFWKKRHAEYKISE